MSGAYSPFATLSALFGALILLGACSTVGDTATDNNETPPLADPEPAPTTDPPDDSDDAAGDDDATDEDADDSSTSDPTITDPTTPIEEDFDTVEYQSQSALEQIGALAAYEVSGDGAGVIVGIIDSGIDVSNTEFVGRIHEDSADLVISGVVESGDERADGPNLQDSDDHGTPIASIIGAARDDIGIHGVAPEVELLVFRADDDTDDQSLLGNAVIEGVERSARIGAGVLNFSFGSDDASARNLFEAIFEFTRDNDIVVATAAGNEGDTEPNESALGALNVAGDPTVVVVGSVDGGGIISGFSNQAGSAAEIYLVAPGELIQTTFTGAAAGETRYFSGTSAAVPHVAGAAALIRQLWPALTASEVVDILFTSATDLGDAGVDAVYGRGLLNLEAAVDPLGDVTTTSATGTITSTSDLAVGLSTVFGPSFADIPEIIVFDSYHRDFKMDLSTAVQSFAPNSFDIENRLNPFEKQNVAAHQINNRLTANFRLSSRDSALTDYETHRTTRLMGVDWAREHVDSVLATSFTQQLAEGQRLTVSQGFSAVAVDKATTSLRRSPFLSLGFFSDSYLPLSQSTIASRFKAKIASNIDVDLLASHSADENTLDAGAQSDANRFSDKRVTTVRTGLGINLGSWIMRVEQGLRQEAGAVLDAVFDGDTQASTLYAAVDADWAMTPNWRLKGRYATGHTNADTDGFGGFIEGFSGVRSTQYSLAVARSDLFETGDSLWIGASKPLAIRSGAAELILPTGYDYRTDTISYTYWSSPLAVDANRYDLEARYHYSLGRYGSIDLNIIHQLLPTYEIESATAFIVRSGVEF